MYIGQHVQIAMHAGKYNFFKLKPDPTLSFSFLHQHSRRHRQMQGLVSMCFKYMSRKCSAKCVSWRLHNRKRKQMPCKEQNKQQNPTLYRNDNAPNINVHKKKNMYRKAKYVAQCQTFYRFLLALQTKLCCMVRQHCKCFPSFHWQQHQKFP